MILQFEMKTTGCNSPSVQQMVVVHSYRPSWPDELELCAGDVILVLSKHEEERWFGRLQDGQRGYFPASCVMELSQVGWLPEWAQQCSITGLCCCCCLISGGRLYFLFFHILLFCSRVRFQRSCKHSFLISLWLKEILTYCFLKASPVQYMRLSLLVTRSTTHLWKTF